jgi:hypothetical protein
LESRAINSFDPQPTVFLRYVDDIFFLWSESTRPIKEFHQHLNNQNASITFTVEKEVEGVIPFLDALVKRMSYQKTETEVYRKTTDSGLYFQYDSNHPKAVRNGIINTMLYRAETHTSTAYNQEIDRVKEILIINKY